jgi:protein associated with RNAse G/E
MSKGLEQADGDARILVRSFKYDGRLHREWPAHLTEHAGSLIVLDGVFAEEVHHPLLGHIRAGTHSAEYFWTDRWYSVFRFSEPAGSLRNYYCNINQPVRLNKGILSFVDLDIDVLVAPDFTHTVLDEDEFAAHAARYAYPDALRANVQHALAELLQLIAARAFPFDR